MTVSYFQSKGFELVPASEPNKLIAYVPYEKYPSAKQHLCLQDKTHSLRFNHDYSIAIFCFEGSLDTPEWELHCDSLRYEEYMYLLEYDELWLDNETTQPTQIALSDLPDLIRSSLEKALKECHK